MVIYAKYYPTVQGCLSHCLTAGSGVAYLEHSPVALAPKTV